MSWVPILALAALAFLLAALALKLPRAGWALFGSALLFGLAGYALQGSPGQPAAPRAPAVKTDGTGELVVEARREFFPPNQLPARYVLTADAFARRGQYEDAASFLRNAVEENPDDAEAWLALGNALVEHADGQLTAPALYAYSRAEEVDPANPGAAYFVGLTLLRSGQPGRARAIWSDMLQNAPENAPWRSALEQRIERLDGLIGGMQAQ